MVSSVCVVIPTHDRAQILRTTLEAMESVDRHGLQVEWVVVDNNSTDDTPTVIKSFKQRLPLCHLTERRPGKNHALNNAINYARDCDIIVFTDDDVSPEEGWLRAIVSSTERHPECCVFGGRINPMWPQMSLPGWVFSRMALDIGFCAHRLGDCEQAYPLGVYPFGANVWIRRSVFDEGRRYNGAIGPRPTNRIMGSETSLLRELEQDGYSLMHVPNSIVWHRIEQSQVRICAMLQRAYRHGRSRPHLGRMPEAALLSCHPTIWTLRRCASLGKFWLWFALATFRLREADRVEGWMHAIAGFACNLEALRHSRGHGLCDEESEASWHKAACSAGVVQGAWLTRERGGSA